jgi:hypothetical protein
MPTLFDFISYMGGRIDAFERDGYESPVGKDLNEMSYVLKNWKEIDFSSHFSHLGLLSRIDIQSQEVQDVLEGDSFGGARDSIKSEVSHFINLWEIYDKSMRGGYSVTTANPARPHEFPEGHYRWNHCAHTLIEVPVEGLTISCKTQCGKTVFFSFLPYQGPYDSELSGRMECVDIKMLKGGRPVKAADHRHEGDVAQRLLLFDGGSNTGELKRGRTGFGDKDTCNMVALLLRDEYYEEEKGKEAASSADGG